MTSKRAPTRPHEKAEEEILALHNSSEKRLMALGKLYVDLTLDEKQLAQVEEDLRHARMYEVIAMSSIMRQAEIDEQRRILLDKEQKEEEERQKRLVRLQMLRQKSLQLLQEEADASKQEADKRLAEDRRLLLQKEKERLLERRRKFELQQAEELGGGSEDVLAARGPPILVMNVALGNGKEDKIVVRQNDDPKRIAAVFAKRHRLPEHSIANLAAQIRSNIAAGGRTSSVPGSFR